MDSHITDNIDPQVKHKILRSSMVFPKTETLKKDPSLVYIKYRCDDQRCDFTDAIKAISMNQEFQALGVVNILKSAVEDISEHHEAYLLNLFDGFQINQSNQNLLRLERVGSDGSGRTGFLEYNSFRQELMEECHTNRLITIVRETIQNTNRPICTIL
jgi:hypothetical protein